MSSWGRTCWGRTRHGAKPVCTVLYFYSDRRLRHQMFSVHSGSPVDPLGYRLGNPSYFDNVYAEIHDQ